MALIVQTLGVVGTLSAATIAVRSYVNSNKRAEESKKKEQQTQELALKAQQQNLETRQAQLFMQIYDKSTQKEFMRDFLEIQDWKWTDFDDYIKKYNDNRDNLAKLYVVSDYFEGIGVLVKRKLIDPELVDDLMSSWVINYWEKIGPVTVELRHRWSFPQANEHVEFLYNEVKRISKSQHREFEGKEKLSYLREQTP